MTPLVRTFLLLGSNEGDSSKNLALARTALAQAGDVVHLSSVYRTAAWGKEDQPDFLNQVVALDTPLAVHDLLMEVQAIEQSLGRVRKERWAQRTIDIDILFYGREVITEKDLIVPHRAMAERRFTLMPLAEIAPDLIHPVLKRSIRELLESCTDPLEVRLEI